MAKTVLRLRTEAEFLESYLENLKIRAGVYDHAARVHNNPATIIRLEGKAESLFELIDDLEEKYIYPEHRIQTSWVVTP